MNINKIVFSILICFSSFHTSYAINDSIDILLQNLNNCKPIEKTEILNKLAIYYQDSDFTNTILYSEQAIESAKSTNDTNGLADAYYSLGNIQLLKGENSFANKNLTKAYNLYYLKKDKHGIARSSDNLASIFRYTGSYEKSLEFHLKALAIFNELKDTNGIIGSKNNLGILYRNLDNYPKSISYYHEALSLAIKSKSKLLSTVYNSIGSYYWYKHSNDSALYFYRCALKIKPVTLLLKERHCAALNNIGNVYRSIGNLDSALYYYQLSLQKSKKYELNNLSSITLKNFGIVYNQSGKSNEARRYFEESISLAKKSSLKRIICDDYQLLSEICSKQGDYKKAIDYYKNYSTIHDSIFNDDQADKINQLEIEFLLQQKEMDNAVLSKNLAEQNLVIQRNNNLLIIFSLIIAFFIILSVAIYRYLKLSKKSANALQELNEELERRVKARTMSLQKEIEEHNLTTAALIKAKEKAEESDRLKSSFLANLSHEIRTPMNAIQGFTELLNTTDLTSHKKDEYISIIRKSGDKLLLIISDIIEISKIDAGQIIPHYTAVNINNFIKELFQTIQVTIPQEKDIELRLIKNNHDSDLHFSTDEVKLLQVMTNLLNNAIKFTEKGYVAFGYEIINETKIKFFVKDTGIGIEKKYQDIIFERFRQIEGDLAIIKGGSGLGLSISKAYVEMLGGKILLESELGKGSLFSFTIPLIKADKTIPITLNGYSKEIMNDGEDRLILIAEDDDINYIYFKEIMSKLKYRLIRACNGKEAVEICTKHDVQLVLMDIKMPVMDGYEALKEIRLIKPNLQVIAQTSHALHEDKKRINQAGFNGYLTKPIKKEELFHLIESLINNVSSI